MNVNNAKQTIAVIGSGISGLVAAYLLQQKYQVALFEKDNRLGGHSHTQTIHIDQQTVAVDSGFIVFNPKTYPNFVKLLQHLQIETEPSNMSFSVQNTKQNIEYAGGGINQFFSQRCNIINPKFWKLLYDINKFNLNSHQFLNNLKNDTDMALEQWLEHLNLGYYFKQYYLYPMASAIWSCPINSVMQFSTRSFLSFYANHGLLQIRNHPQWQTLKYRSKHYVETIANQLHSVTLNAEITGCQQGQKGNTLTFRDGSQQTFDHIVFACHSDTANQILATDFKQQKQLLAQIRYQPNKAVLHTDTTVMPKSRRTWSSWNYHWSNQQQQASLTYWMNLLQNLQTQTQVFVTLNPSVTIDPNTIISEHIYHHPILDFNAVAAQKQFDNIQGVSNLWFCGAWLGHGFHEDGVVSAIAIAEQLKCQFV